MPAVVPERPECCVRDELLPMRSEGMRIRMERGLMRGGQIMCCRRQRMRGRCQRVSRRRRERRVTCVCVTERRVTCVCVTQIGVDVTGDAVIGVREPRAAATVVVTREIRMSRIETRARVRGEARSCVASEVWNAATARMPPTAAKMWRVRKGERHHRRRGSARADHPYAVLHHRPNVHRHRRREWPPPPPPFGLAASAAPGGRCQHQTDDAGAGRDLERN